MPRRSKIDDASAYAWRQRATPLYGRPWPCLGYRLLKNPGLDPLSCGGSFDSWASTGCLWFGRRLLFDWLRFLNLDLFLRLGLDLSTLMLRSDLTVNKRWFDLKTDRGFRLGRRQRLIEKGRNESFLGAGFDLKMKWLGSFCRLFDYLPRFGLRMTTTHHARIQTLFHHLAGGGLEHGLASQNGGAAGLLVEGGFDPLCFVVAQQARIRACVGEFQPITDREHILD